MTASAQQDLHRDRLIGYLLSYVRKQHGPWNFLAGELRFASSRSLHLAGQKEFEQLARALADRFEKFLGAQRPMRLAVLTAQEANAFATAPLECDGVLLTKGAFDRIQELARSAAYGLYALIEQRDSAFPLVRIWGGHQPDEDALYGFGSVVAHVMTAALVHHEIAHLVLGHEWAWRYVLEKSDGEPDPKQCLELDADLHAIHFTENYLAERILQVPLDDDPLNRVWHTLLDEPGSRSLIVLLCAYLYLVAVTPCFGVPSIAELRTGTHPHLIVRQLLALLAQQRWREVTASDSVDLVYFAAAVNASTSNGISPATPEEVVRVQGLQALSCDPDAFQQHIAVLAQQLLRYEPKLNELMRLSEEQRIRWFAA